MERTPATPHSSPRPLASTKASAKTAQREPVLLVGSDSKLQRALVDELRGLRTPVARARSLEDAIHRADQLRHRPSILLVPDAQIDPDTFEEQRAELQIRAGTSRLVPIAIGRRPSEQRRDALREAGIRLALFGRFGRHALRFQINRALSPFASTKPRGDLRAPMEWRTRTYSSGREKAVRCYSLSTGGAYFVTPRPWIVGSEIALELPLLGENRLVEAKVLYTKAANPSERPSLPGGMAVAFGGLSDEMRRSIRENLTQSRSGLEV